MSHARFETFQPLFLSVRLCVFLLCVSNCAVLRLPDIFPEVNDAWLIKTIFFLSASVWIVSFYILNFHFPKFHLILFYLFPLFAYCVYVSYKFLSMFITVVLMSMAVNSITSVLSKSVLTDVFLSRFFLLPCRSGNLFF